MPSHFESKLKVCMLNVSVSSSTGARLWCSVYAHVFQPVWASSEGQRLRSAYLWNVSRGPQHVPLLCHHSKIIVLESRDSHLLSGFNNAFLYRLFQWYWRNLEQRTRRMSISLWTPLKKLWIKWWSLQPTMLTENIYCRFGIPYRWGFYLLQNNSRSDLRL